MDNVTSSPTSVYLYYDHSDILIYVGITSRGIKRQAEHNDTKDWWQFVARQEVEHFADRPTALARERGLIEDHTPPFNKQHNRVADHVRSAYMLFRAAYDQPMAIRDAVRAMEQRIDLDHHQFGESENLILRTRLSDALVVAAMQMPEGEAPRAFGIKKNSPTKVHKIERRGPIALLHTGSHSTHPILDAYATVKFDAKQRLRLRNVHVRLDHSDPKACTKRCPSNWVRPESQGAA